MHIISTGHFLQNHYREAVSTITTLQTELLVIKNQLGIMDVVFSQYIVEEKKYLHELKQESPTTTMKAQYVWALNELSQCRYGIVLPNMMIVLTKIRQEWHAARTAANEICTRPPSGPIHLMMGQVHCRIDTAYSKMQNAESYVESLENSLDIEQRWTEASPDYKTFYQENVLTNYEWALDDLEWLVVMQLFELTKMSSLGTGLYLT
jgi:hypothetical protein